MCCDWNIKKCSNILKYFGIWYFISIYVTIMNFKTLFTIISQKKVWNIFEIDNKDTRMTTKRNIWYFTDHLDQAMKQYWNFFIFTRRFFVPKIYSFVQVFIWLFSKNIAGRNSATWNLICFWQISFQKSSIPWKMIRENLNRNFQIQKGKHFEIFSPSRIK